MDKSLAVKTRNEIYRRNGRLGGVKTSAGKAISKYNAQKHGVLRKALTIYERDSYGHLLKELNQQFKPVGFIEKAIVERIGLWYIRLYRNSKAEGEFMNGCLFPDKHKTMKFVKFPDEDMEGEESVGYHPRIKPEHIERLGEVYARYDTVFENRILKLLHELERLQRMRFGGKVSEPLVMDVTHYGRGFGSFGELDPNQDSES